MCGECGRCPLGCGHAMRAAGRRVGGVGGCLAVCLLQCRQRSAGSALWRVQRMAFGWWACELRYALFWSFACGGANCRLGSGLAGCWTLVLGRNRRHGFCPSAQLPRACSTSAAIRFVKRWKSKPRRLQVGSHIYNTSSQPT
jgi:hypothetical protein